MKAILIALVVSAVLALFGSSALQAAGDTWPGGGAVQIYMAGDTWPGGG